MENQGKFAVNPRDGVKIHYRLSGNRNKSNPRVVIAGGLNHPASVWGEELSPLREQYPVLTFDLRGVGESDKPKGEFAYDMSIYAEDILAVLEAENIREAHFLGHSYGSAVVQEFYNRYPERVLSLILVSAVWSIAHTILPDSRDFRTYLKILMNPYLATPEERMSFSELTLKVLFGSQFLARHPQKAWDYLNAVQQNTPPEALTTFFYRHMALRRYTNSRLDRIEVPVLVLHGSEDGYIPVENAREISRRIPRSRLAILVGAGHHPALEQPEAFNREVLRHLKEC